MIPWPGFTIPTYCRNRPGIIMQNGKEDIRITAQEPTNFCRQICESNNGLTQETETLDPEVTHTSPVPIAEFDWSSV